MTKYQINPDDDVWNAIKAIKPDSCNLDDYVEGVLARHASMHRDDLDQDQIRAANRILEDSDVEVPR